MVAMRITILNVTEVSGVVRASLRATVPSIAARARITLTFAALPGSGPKDWWELAYDRALVMLDSA